MPVAGLRYCYCGVMMSREAGVTPGVRVGEGFFLGWGVCDGLRCGVFVCEGRGRGRGHSFPSASVPAAPRVAVCVAHTLKNEETWLNDDDSMPSRRQTHSVKKPARPVSRSTAGAQSECLRMVCTHTRARQCGLRSLLPQGGDLL